MLNFWGDIQAAQLWDHGELLNASGEAEEQYSDLEERLKSDPPRPPLDLEQALALRAEFLRLVPSIHEVIDRSQEDRRLVMLALARNVEGAAGMNKSSEMEISDPSRQNHNELHIPAISVLSQT